MAGNYNDKKIYNVGGLKCTILDVMKMTKLSKSGAYQRLLKFTQGKLSAVGVLKENAHHNINSVLHEGKWGIFTGEDRSKKLEKMPDPTRYDKELRSHPMLTASHE